MKFDRTKFLLFSLFGLTYAPQFFEQLIGRFRILKTLNFTLRSSEKTFHEK